MSTDSARDRLQEAGLTAWRAAVLTTATVLILILYVGMAFLVYRGRMADGPLVLFTGVVVGYVLRSVRGLL